MPADDHPRLMRAIARGSENAFRRLVERHQAALLNFFRRMGADAHEAEDATQETLLRLFGYRDRYRPQAPFTAFLFTLARHVWIDDRRRRRRSPVVESQVVEASWSRPEPSVAQEERLDLEGALAELTPGHRMVLVLSVFHGLLYREVSEIMGIPEGTVKSRVFHALRKLRARLAPASRR